jgi:hypothetical protein
MTTTFSQTRCFNHSVREAVAKCPGCKKDFCRECTSEHEDRILCKDCLTTETKVDKKGPGFFSKIFVIARICLSLFWAFFVFYIIGVLLNKIPSEFHDGNFLRDAWWLMN